MQDLYDENGNSWKEHYVVKSKPRGVRASNKDYSWKEHYVVKSKPSHPLGKSRRNSWKEHYVVKSKLVIQAAKLARGILGKNASF